MVKLLVKTAREEPPGVVSQSDILAVYRHGNMLLNFTENKVTDTKAFNDRFQEGDKVLEAHFYCTNKEETLIGLRAFQNIALRYHKLGFKGLYGDTPNTTLKSKLAGIGADIMPTPSDYADEIRDNYKQGVKEWGFPSEYADEPIERVILHFDDVLDPIAKIKPLSLKRKKELEIVFLRERDSKYLEEVTEGARSRLSKKLE